MRVLIVACLATLFWLPSPAAAGNAEPIGDPLPLTISEVRVVGGSTSGVPGGQVSGTLPISETLLSPNELAVRDLIDRDLDRDRAELADQLGG